MVGIESPHDQNKTFLSVVLFPLDANSTRTKSMIVWNIIIDSSHLKVEVSYKKF